MFEHDVNHHISRVISVAQQTPRKNAGPMPDAAIARSWERCLDSYGLDPARTQPTLVLEHGRLREHQDRLDNILEIARLEMNLLYQQISRSGFAILLTDSNGVIVNSVSDPVLVKAFTEAGLWLGAVWSEQHEGTNGIGTCLMEKQPLTVHQDDHFRSRHIHLSCSASPIFDPQGRLLAVLDASSVTTRDSKQSQFHTVALVTMSAKLIENCYFIKHFSNQWVLRFHTRPEFVGMLSEGMLAFDGAGRILAANQSALNQLNCRQRDELIGRPISEVFDIRLDTLLQRASQQATTIWPVYDSHGHACSAMLRGPEQRLAIPTPPPSARRTVLPASTPLAMHLDGLQGDDERMAYNVRCAKRVMNKNVTILLHGETGTGKEAFAKAIHQASNRAGKPFVAINCASIPESLIESELFGYKHGAFTGARREGMRGKILQANGGTLFLDEIGDMPPHLQTRLLRVLEEKEVLPLGGEVAIPVDLHVISATHRNLDDLVNTGEFREDLYYRLNGLILTLPSLRDRPDRIALIHGILAAESERQVLQIDEAAFAALNTYTWPGNIRQLRNVIRTAVALCENHTIRLEDLPPVLTHQMPPIPCSGSLPDNSSPASALSCAEKEALLRELEHHRWNITNTANHLEISRNTLYRKMKKHGIIPPSLS